MDNNLSGNFFWNAVPKVLTESHFGEGPIVESLGILNAQINAPM